MEEVFNLLTIKEHISKPKDNNKYKSWNSKDWVRCICECGNEVIAPLNAIQKGYIKSCGCLRSQTAISILNKYRDSSHNAINITYDNETHNISEWSKITGIPRTTIMYRLSKEMPIDKVLERKDDNECISN